LTTPNVASLFRRLKLLLGRSPIYRYHVKEYTKLEVETLLKKNGFRILRSNYSTICDKTCLNPNNEKELRSLVEAKTFLDMLRFMLRNINQKINIARVLAYPLIKLVPSFRMQIVIVAKKSFGIAEEKHVKRWG
jgi:hypothetical protein